MKFDTLVVQSGITGSLEGNASTSTTASYSVTASSADQVTGYLNIPAGLDVTGSLVVTGGITGSLGGTIQFPEGLLVTGSITGSGLLMTTREAASASAGGTYTSAEQDLLNQIRATLIKYGMMT